VLQIFLIFVGDRFFTILLQTYEVLKCQREVKGGADSDKSECGQTERGKSEQDKAHISVDPDFAQTDFAQTELAKTMFCKSGIP
jgi:hypothetical protein